MRRSQWRGNTYAALEGAAVDIVAVKLANRHGRVLMRVHLDEGEAAVGLEARLDDEAKVLEERHNVVLGRVRGQVAHVAGGLPGRRLVHDHVVAVDAVGGEVVVAVGRGRGHAHLLHGLLLGHGRLALLVGPVAANGAGTEPLAVHGAQRLLSIGALAEGHEAVAAGAASLHVPHDTGLGHGAEGGEGVQQGVVIHLVREIADEDVEMVRRVLLVVVVGLVGPVDTDFLRSAYRLAPDQSTAHGIAPLILFEYSRETAGRTYRLVDATAVEGLHGALSGTGIVVLDEAVVVALGLNCCNNGSVDGSGRVQRRVRRGRRAEVADFLESRERLQKTCQVPGRLTFLSGMILTLWTWPVVSKI